MSTCPQGIEIPSPLIEPCKGIYTSDSCIIHPQALVELGLTADSSINTIIETMYTAIVSMQNRLTALENV